LQNRIIYKQSFIFNFDGEIEDELLRFITMAAHPRAARAPRQPQLAVTITFCEVAENGPGMEKLGAERGPGGGLSVAELHAAAERLRADGVECEIVDLRAAGELAVAVAAAATATAAAAAPAEAAVLIVRNPLPALLRRAGYTGAAADAAALEAALAGAALAGAALAGAPEVVARDAAYAAAGTAAGAPLAAGDAAAAAFAEQAALMPITDRKALFRGKLLNKNARWNLCFDARAQEPALAEGRGRIVPFAALPLLAAVRSQLPYYFGAAKATDLLAEGNYYYDAGRTGIGFHGDGERRLVIALRLGAPIPLHYQWFLRSAPQGARIALQLRPGDLYAMSEKAVGTDWKRSSIWTLRHAAGAEPYLRTKQ